MKVKTPSYITKNRLGIYYFQYLIPRDVSYSQNRGKCFFKKSLRTRNRSEALEKSRFLCVIMTSINKKYFKNPFSHYQVPSNIYEFIFNYIESDDVANVFNYIKLNLCDINALYEKIFNQNLQKEFQKIVCRETN